MIENSTAITWGGVVAIAALFGVFWRVVSYVRNHVTDAIDRQEARFKEALGAQHLQLREALDVIHKRIDRANEEAKQIRSEYVRREDLDRHLKTIDKKLDGLGVRFDDLREYLRGRPGA